MSRLAAQMLACTAFSPVSSRDGPAEGFAAVLTAEDVVAMDDVAGATACGSETKPDGFAFATSL